MKKFQKLYFVRVEFFLRKHQLKKIGKVECHQHSLWLTDDREIIVLSGVV